MNLEVTSTETGGRLTHKDGRRPRVVILSSSLLVDRVLQHTDLVARLSDECEPVIWATSRDSTRNSSIWESVDAPVDPLPEIRPFKEIPHNYLRRLNEFAWDYQFRLPSRMSMMKHVRDRNQSAAIKALKFPAWLVAKMKLEGSLEDAVERMMLGYPRSEEAERRLKELDPVLLVTTGPFQYEQPAIFAAAKNLGIPTLAYIPSWDNVTTKNRLVYKYDGYVVWSEQTRRELHHFYPASRDVPVFVVGAPQFDVFFQERYYLSKQEFCSQQGLDPDLPTIVYALGSPNFLKEHHGAIEFAKRVANGEIGNVQMLVRPHPIHDNAELMEAFRPFAPLVRLQETPNAGIDLNERSQDKQQIIEWINTFRHADVVVNLSSTVTVDAAIFDKPIVNLDFDPHPGRPHQQLVKDINHSWNHFQPIAESGGVTLVNDYDEMAAAVKLYLDDPGLHRQERKQITEYVCGYVDGRCAVRMADAIKGFCASAAMTRNGKKR